MLNLRWLSVCVVCGTALPAGSRAKWDATTRRMTCAACVEPRAEPKTQAGVGESTQSALDRGQPGAGIAREYQRRKRKRESHTRKTHPWIGELLLALRGTPQHESAFHQGDLGEKAVAVYLEKHTARGSAIILHNRRMPGGRGDIDHLAIAPTGVFVIDAKNIKGKARVAKPLLGDAKLLIAGRNRTKLIDGLDRQVSAVRYALTANGHSDVWVQGVLCFTIADLPLLGTPKMRGHLLLRRKALAKRINKQGSLRPPTIDALARTLAAALPPA
jgi:Nuclease-related domain